MGITNITARATMTQRSMKPLSILRKRKNRQGVYTGLWSIYALPTLVMWNGT